MCDLCKTIEDERQENDGFLTEEQTEEAFAGIAEQMKQGTSPEHFQNVLDSILDTQMTERDRDAEAVWQRGNGHQDA